jgi:alpha/beta superfamily hydrolase
MKASTHQTTPILIDGPIGPLEALLSEPKEAATACGLVCHPDPTQEGTMHNKVVTAINWAMECMGWVTLRFNYRGVGQSAGKHGKTLGELEDTRSIYEWLHHRFPELPFHAAGFSFGAFMASQLATEVPTDSLFTAAPVLSRGNYEHLARVRCPWLAVVGEEDELVSIDEIKKYMEDYQQPMKLTVFPQTTHFFHGQLIPLRETVRNFYQNLS